MTALPHLSAEMTPHGAPMSPQHTPPGGYPMEVPHGLGSPGVNVPEYPWMKEKKTTRKNSQQGESQTLKNWWFRGKVCNKSIVFKKIASAQKNQPPSDKIVSESSWNW